MKPRVPPVSAGVLAALLAVICQGMSGDLHGQLLVDADWLAQRLDQPGVVVLHVGSSAGYHEGHVPGAALLVPSQMVMDYEDPLLEFELPPADSLRTLFGHLGVADDSRIVVVAQDRRNILMATRAVFTLSWLGFEDQVALLDGGLVAWSGGGHPLSSDPVEPAPQVLARRPIRPELVVTGDWLRENLETPNLALVDARSAESYRSQPGPGRSGMMLPGHIPGAVNLNYDSFVRGQNDLRLKSTQEIVALFRSQGVEAGSQLVVYCHIGMQATMAWFAARVTGHEVALYDGSYHGWGRLADPPLEFSPAQ